MSAQSLYKLRGTSLNYFEDRKELAKLQEIDWVAVQAADKSKIVYKSKIARDSCARLHLPQLGKWAVTDKPVQSKILY